MASTDVAANQPTLIFEANGTYDENVDAQLALQDTLDYLSQRPAGPRTQA